MTKGRNGIPISALSRRDEEVEKDLFAGHPGGGVRRKGRKVFEIEGRREIDIPREAPQLNEAEERGSPNDRDSGGKLLGYPVQEREILQLSSGKHGVYLKNSR